MIMLIVIITNSISIFGPASEAAYDLALAMVPDRVSRRCFRSVNYIACAHIKHPHRGECRIENSRFLVSRRPVRRFRAGRRLRPRDAGAVRGWRKSVSYMCTD